MPAVLKSASPRPDLHNLRKREKNLLRAHKARGPEFVLRIKRFFPKLATFSMDEIGQARFSLQDAQLAIARENGLASWSRMEHEL